jgi:hypothetical protein
MFKHYLYMLVIFLVLLYAMYCGFMCGMNARESIFMRFVSLVVFVMATFLFLQRDTYLPFLGPAAVPSSLFKGVSVPPGSNVETDVVINAPDGTRVLYWGAEPKTGDEVKPDPVTAYGTFKNVGIAVVEKGKVRFRFFCPVKYQVPWGKTLDRHIHYRLVSEKSMLGRVETVYVNC